MELLNPMSKADYPSYSVAYTGTAGSTTAWLPGPQGVLVWSDQACYIEVGVGATATTAAPRSQLSPRSRLPYRLTRQVRRGASARSKCQQAGLCIVSLLTRIDT